jgi:hypothetical protein
MEKQEGWGQAVPDNLKNGTWVFAAYGSDGKPLAEDFTTCRACHAPLAQKDFVHRYDEFCARSHRAHQPAIVRNGGRSHMGPVCGVLTYLSQDAHRGAVVG